jgi:tRNA threonylcarbamoyladenosine biosynthesis protein TsaE
MEGTVRNLEELSAAARAFVEKLSPKEDGATLITLSGELGAGKTAFTKALASALGVEEEVTSPTFVLEKVYLLPEGRNFSRLAHIDAYRLKEGSELAALGFDELMKDKDTLVILEWPERVQDALPHATHTLTLTSNAEGVRTISYA